MVYCDPGAIAYDQLHRTRLINGIIRRAQQFGLSLIYLQTGELLHHAAVPQTVS